MKLLLLIFATVLAVTWAHPTANKELAAAQEMVDFINKQKTTWTAKVNTRMASMTKEEIKGMLGAKKRHERAKQVPLQPKFTGKAADIPKEFDARVQWPQCTNVIGVIADQSSCGSCWAVSSASVMSDRVCIGTNGNNKTPISAADITSCCADCGFGCEGGWPDEAFAYWCDRGVVSGSGYIVDQGCSPYPFAPCEHHTNKTKYPACPKSIYDTPKCQKKCQSSYTKNAYSKDKMFGKNQVYYSFNNEGVQKEIMTNGPVVFTYDVYADFILYNDGVYQHTTGDLLGGHAVRAIGWGEENGTPYWLIANSWNEDWAGLGGYFKIIRGTDDCGIEEEISAALYQG